jgi:glycosyltransferase involved in cell wall biosynthesis
MHVPPSPPADPADVGGPAERAEHATVAACTPPPSGNFGASGPATPLTTRLPSPIPTHQDQPSGPVHHTARILHVINGEHYSGAERVQDLLALRLAPHGFNVGFACLKEGRFAAERKAVHAPLHTLRMRSRFDLRPARDLARLVRSHGYALIHTHTPRALLVGRLAAMMARVPIVHHLHSPALAESTHTLRNWLNACTERLALTGAAHLVAVSESLATYARRIGMPAERVSVVHNGVPALGPLPLRPAPRLTWNLGMVALFRPRKGLEVLLEALARLKAAGERVRLLAVGPFETAPYEQAVRHTASLMGLEGTIEWRGFRSDVFAELQQMDLFVLPSLFGEGLPMVILEAMAAGVPVVASRVEGVPEVIRHGVDGLLVAPGDAHDLAETIRSVLHGQVCWRTLRRQAHARQAQVFSDESMAIKLATIYRKILCA